MTTLLKINLNSGETAIEKDESLRREYLGGLGVNTRLLYDLLAQGTDPLAPENVLIFGAGSLTGVLLPTACRTEVSAKSPLSGLFGTSNAGGEWGPRLRYAGFDHLVITGRSPEPAYIVIDNENIAVKSAAEIWGKDVWEATDWLKETHGHDFCAAVIGPAGENMVRFASIQNDYFASWGRTGMGAVMGSKNLKAVIVRGSGSVPVHDPKGLNRIRREAFQRVQEDPTFGIIRRYGSMVGSDPFNQIGSLPGHNFNRGSFDNWEQARGRKAFESGYKVKDVACFSCPIACCHWSRVEEEGPYEGYETRGLEITFVLEFGAKLGLESVPEIFQCVELCNRQGMDVISAAGAAAYLAESFQKRAVKEKEIGFPVSFGDFTSLYRLMEMIAAREGIGDILAHGVKRAGEMLPGTERFAMHVKGVEMPTKDPRAKMDVWALGYLTNTRGGDSLRTRSPVEAIKGGLVDHQTEALEVDQEYIARLDMPEDLKKKIFGDPPSGINIPAMAVYSENLITIINSTGLCIRPQVLRSLGPDFYARALNALYGYEFDELSIYRTAENIYSLQHRFNRREGESFSSYQFPTRFYKETLTADGCTHLPLRPAQVLENIRDYMNLRRWEQSWDGEHLKG